VNGDDRINAKRAARSRLYAQAPSDCIENGFDLGALDPDAPAQTIVGNSSRATSS
jgi:hypothetical protein